MGKMKSILGLIAGTALVGGSIYSLAKKKADEDADYYEDCENEDEELEDVEDSEKE